MTDPFISVVLPTHNRVAFLKKAVGSVLRQTEKNFELIIVDDGSTDDTPRYLRQLIKNDSRIKVIRNTVPLGGGGARNIGIHASKAKWIAFLDDDDEWVENKLVLQLQRVKLSPNAVACSCNYVYNYSFGFKRVITIPETISLDQLYLENLLGGASMCLCLREVLMEVGGFDTKLRSGQDWDLWVKLKTIGEVVVCNDPLVRYIAHTGLRITNNMQSQYFGVRRFHFKYREKMTKASRRFKVCHACFIKCLDRTKNLRFRLYYLRLAVRFSNFSTGMAYSRIGIYRLISDSLSKSEKG